MLKGEFEIQHDVYSTLLLGNAALQHEGNDYFKTKLQIIMLTRIYFQIEKFTFFLLQAC